MAKLLEHKIMTEGTPMPDSLTSYCMTKDGCIKISTNGIVRYTSKTDDIPNLQEIKADEITYIGTKIPFNIIADINSFFTAVWKKDKTEASAFIVQNRAGEYSVFIPKQRNGGASSRYQRNDDDAYKEIMETHSLIVSAHSHPWAASTPPHPSGIDDGDEHQDILYAVFGNMDGEPQISWSTIINGKRHFFTEKEVVDIESQEEVFINEMKTVIPEQFLAYLDTSKYRAVAFASHPFEVPLTWMLQCTKFVDVPKKTTYVSGWQNKGKNNIGYNYGKSYNKSNKYGKIQTFKKNSNNKHGPVTIIKPKNVVRPSKEDALLDSIKDALEDQDMITMESMETIPEVVFSLLNTMEVWDFRELNALFLEYNKDSIKQEILSADYTSYKTFPDDDMDIPPTTSALDGVLRVDGDELDTPVNVKEEMDREE